MLYQHIKPICEISYECKRTLTTSSEEKVKNFQIYSLNNIFAAFISIS